MILSRILKVFKDPWHYVFLALCFSRRLWPDKLYLSLIYRAKMGHWINWKSPQTFTEKIQWLKLYNRKPIYTTMVDKAEVKKYVANIIGDQYIIPTIGCWNNVEDIDWDSLPEQFVLKTTHGGGGCGIVICKDKANFDRAAAKKKLQKSLDSDIYYTYREWPYKNVPRRIIAEKFIELSGKNDLIDYKIYCFSGEPTFIQVIQDRNTEETIDFYDLEWNHQGFIGLNPNVHKAKKGIPKPKNLNEMVWAARKLSNGHDFVRVDLYEIEEGILFGELTFFPSSGIGVFSPDKWDTELGKLLVFKELENSSSNKNSNIQHQHMGRG